MKAVLQYRLSPGARARLEAVRPPWLAIAIVDEDDAEPFAHEMRTAEVLLHVLKPVTAAVIAGAPRLGLIQKIGIGVNTIDLAAARAHGVGVANMPGMNTPAVVELTLALMLAALRRLPALDAATRRGTGWHLDPATVDQAGELGGRVVGLVGYGAVARRLAPVLRALDARVVYTARSAKPEAPDTFLPLPDLLAGADVVSLHLPLTPETTRLIDAAALARMKPGAVLVNTARGGLVDEAALVAALESGRLRAAGLDVFGAEPIDPASPLFARPEVVVTPHVAWLTPETLARSWETAIENCRRLRDGEALLHEIVPGRCTAG